jgi:hypothetical protein
LGSNAVSISAGYPYGDEEQTYGHDWNIDNAHRDTEPFGKGQIDYRQSATKNAKPKDATPQSFAKGGKKR